MDEAKLKRKLAEWAGLHFYPDCECINRKGICWGESEATYGKGGKWHTVLPDFTQSLDDCFKWLVPRLVEEYIELEIHLKWLVKNATWSVALVDSFYDRDEDKYFIAIMHHKNPAKALCLAIEKLINEQAKKQV